jgi:DUF4097 and DUF4098 domain-containing protein YvlB
LAQKTGRNSRSDDHDHEDELGRLPRVTGSFEVLSTITSSPRLSVDVTRNHESIPVQVSFDRSRQALTVTTPRVLSFWGQRHDPCVEVLAVLSLPPNSTLDVVSLNTISLDLSLADGLELMSDQVSIESVRGEIFVGEDALIGAKALTLRAVAGRVKADIPTVETARVKTTSGAIKLQLVPANDEAPRTASSLEVSTVSGKVDIREGEGLPNLRYSHSVKSVSGGINLALPFTTASTITSNSGGINARLTPVHIEGAKAGTISTKTLSGKVDVQVEEPRGGGKLDRLFSKHESTSGTQTIQYPQAWEGSLAARSAAGTVTVEGKDVRVRKGKKGIVEGTKGKGKSRLDAKGMSGGIRVVIGEV